MPERESFLKMNFREQFQQGRPLFGCFSKTSDVMFIEAMGLAGMDFAILDMEHGPNSLREVLPLILAAQNAGVAPIVRVDRLDALQIQRVMDLGVAGIQIPQIQSKHDAARVSQFTKFHPTGRRGVCRYVRPAEYSLKDKAAFFSGENEKTVIVHVEGQEGLDCLDDIIASESIDVVFIGPYDLSQSLGIPGEVDDPILLKAIREIVERCQRKHKRLGIFTDSVEAARSYAGLGIQYIAYSVDVGIFAQACRQSVEAFHAK